MTKLTKVSLVLTSVHQLLGIVVELSVYQYFLSFEEVTTHIDDEYAWAGVEDPKIMVTTSHSPSSRLKQFAKELRLIFPNSQRLNRGNYVMSQLVQACRANDVTDLIIAHEHRGEPGTMEDLINLHMYAC